MMLLILLNSCKITSVNKVLKSGKYQSDEKIVEIDFEYYLDLIFIPVEVDGVKYKFLFDTGAPNVISSEIANRLSVKSKVNDVISDSKGNRQDSDFVIIPKIKIGNAFFLKTGAVVSEMNQTGIISCLKIDGILGANLMRKSIVQIDYQKQKIRFADDLKKLKDVDGYSINYRTQNQGTPLVVLQLGKQRFINSIVDTGFNGYIKVDKLAYEYIKNDSTVSKSIFYKKIGRGSEGFLGTSDEDTSVFCNLSTFIIDTSLINHTGVLDFEKNSKNLIGNEFLSNFTTTFDWKSKRMYLSPNEKFENKKKFRSYPLGLVKKNNELIVSWVLENSSAFFNGVKTGMKVVEFNGVDITDTTDENICEMIDLLIKNEKKIVVKIQVGNDIKEFQLLKEHLLIGKN